MENGLINPKKLHLGSGLKVLKGYINVDLTKKYGAQVVHDLEKFPYPFKNNEFDEILIDNVLEHLQDTVKVMEELHRISKPGAIIKIIVPHSSGYMAFGSVTHKRFFSSGSFETFKPGYWERYSKANFDILKIKLIWFDSRDWFWIRTIKKIMNKVININHFVSERFLCYPLGGFDHIYFELKKVK
jgi:ubiquinone/menaquinone biosynthesis C-methylase UbiE